MGHSRQWASQGAVMSVLKGRVKWEERGTSQVAMVGVPRVCGIMKEMTVDRRHLNVQTQL
jgi:hypothetical protein